MKDMKTLGIFEIKTKLSQICDDVARTGESVLVTKRGKPLVRIDPLPETTSGGSEVWEKRREYEASSEITDDFSLPERKADQLYNPFDEEHGSEKK
jgi:prevent-host-death family protein